MKTISPWFQTARLLTGIRKAISASETGRNRAGHTPAGRRESDDQLRNVSRSSASS